ncbi:MAG: hypothetical protein WKF96_13600 [Solirubrobacteraceae bacterium]
MRRSTPLGVLVVVVAFRHGRVRSATIFDERQEQEARALLEDLRSAAAS